MKNITVYFLSVARQEYVKRIGGYPREAYEIGAAFDKRLDEEVEDIFTNVEDAMKALSKEKTYIHADGRLLCVNEYAVVEREYNLEYIYEEYKNVITNEQEFLSALKKNPWSFEENYYYTLDYSKREYEVTIVTDKRRYKKKFNNYFEASEWMDEEVERLDSEGVKNCYIA